MNKSGFAVAIASSLLLCGIASASDLPTAPTAAPVHLKEGAVLVSSDGHRIGFVDAIDTSRDGAQTAAQVILDQRIVHVPASTIVEASKNHYTTSLTYRDVGRL